MRVLIIAPADDPHAAAVAAALETKHGVEPQIWDIHDWPCQSQLTLSISDAQPPTLAINGMLKDPFDVAWWRRAGPPAIDTKVRHQAVREFCSAESTHFSRGALAWPNSIVVNDPFSEARANRKPIQLGVARALGIRIPSTLMTNDPRAVKRFNDCHPGGCIYKAFGPASWQMTETRILTATDLEAIEGVAYSPVIVQEYVRPGRDVRVNIFGDRVFAAQVRTTLPEAEIDWRIEVGATWVECSIPQPLATALRRLVAALDLDYGCIDLRQNPEGEFYFLEVNPAGQYLFIEMDTGQPLSESMAQLLVDQYKVSDASHRDRWLPRRRQTPFARPAAPAN